MSKLLVVELDGASWDVIDPLMSAGKMPNLEKLVTHGTSATLMSDPPLLSPKLWTSIFSGKKSAEHGVEFFGSSSKIVRCKRIWDICNDKGLKVGVFGTMVTWPPYPVNGFMIPSLFSIGTETYPEEFQFLQELTLGERRKNLHGANVKTTKRNKLSNVFYYARKLRQHGVRLSTFFSSGKFLLNNFLLRPSQEASYWKKTFLHQRICTEIFASLYRKYRPAFATHHIHFCDALSHRYWKYYEPEKFKDVPADLVDRYGKVIPQAYIEADKNIGDFMAMMDEQTTIMVLSDHGCQALETLRESFKLRNDTFLGMLKLDKKVIPANVGFVTFIHFVDKSIMPKISQILTEACFTESGEKLFDLIHEESLIGVRLSEKFWGIPIDDQSKITLGQQRDVPFSTLFSPHKMDVSGDHKVEGMLVIAGPGIKQRNKLFHADIYDITPTALAVMGLPVGRDMHGNVLEDIFLHPWKQSYVDSYDLENSAADDDENVDIDKVKDRLKSLGYL